MGEEDGLLLVEEVAEYIGVYYRVPVDNYEINYGLYFDKGCGEVA